MMSYPQKYFRMGQKLQANTEKFRGMFISQDITYNKSVDCFKPTQHL